MATAIASAEPLPGQSSTPSQDDNTGDKPGSKYVKLEAAGDHYIYIRRDYTKVSPKLQEMMDNPNIGEKPYSDVNLTGLPPHVVSKVCEYFVYKTKYRDSSKEVPIFPIHKDDALSLLNAAVFLEC